MRHRHSFDEQRREWHMPRLAETVVAVCPWQPSRWRSRYAGRFAFCSRWPLGPLLRFLLVGYCQWRSRLYRCSKRLVWRWWNLVRVAHHGGHSGAREPKNGIAPRQSESNLLSARLRRVWLERQRVLQLQQRDKRRRILRFLRRHTRRYGRELHR